MAYSGVLIILSSEIAHQNEAAFVDVIDTVIMISYASCFTGLLSYFNLCKQWSLIAREFHVLSYKYVLQLIMRNSVIVAFRTGTNGVIYHVA